MVGLGVCLQERWQCLGHCGGDEFCGGMICVDSGWGREVIVMTAALFLYFMVPNRKYDTFDKV